MRTKMFLVALCGALVVGLFAMGGCATVPPKELVDARSSYLRAASGYAAQLDPEELERARQALVEAEIEFRERPTSTKAKDLAYVADRLARLAEVRADTRFTERRAKKARARLEAALHEQKELGVAN
jgi:hypothetical protein